MTMQKNYVSMISSVTWSRDKTKRQKTEKTKKKQQKRKQKRKAENRVRKQKQTKKTRPKLHFVIHANLFRKLEFCFVFALLLCALVSTCSDAFLFD